jgi:hypothetical protein
VDLPSSHTCIGAQLPSVTDAKCTERCAVTQNTSMHKDSLRFNLVKA